VIGFAVAVVGGPLLAPADGSIPAAFRIGCEWNAVQNLGRLWDAIRTGELERFRDWVAAQEVEENPRAVRVAVGRAAAGLTGPGEEILYLDNGETAFWARRPSYLRYFAPLPVQRLRFDPRLRRSRLARVTAARIRRFRRRVVVWDRMWLPPALSPAVDRLLSRFRVVTEIAPLHGARADRLSGARRRPRSCGSA
jgi:hypothetical protein